MDYDQFASIFSIAAPYIPPPSDDDKGDPLSSLSALDIALIVVAVLAAFSFAFFMFNCFCRPKPLAPQPQLEVSFVEYGRPVPATVAYVQNPVNRGGNSMFQR